MKIHAPIVIVNGSFQSLKIVSIVEIGSSIPTSNRSCLLQALQVHHDGASRMNSMARSRNS